MSLSNGETLDASAVIVTVPASIMSKVDYGAALPPLWRRYIAEVGLGRVGKVQAEMNARPWEGTAGRGGEVWQTDPSAGVSLGWDGSVRTVGGKPVRAACGPGSPAPPRWTRADAGAARDQALAFARLADRAVPGMSAATGGYRAPDAVAQGAVHDGRLRQLPPGPADQIRRADLDRDERRRLVAAGPPAPVWFAGEHLSDAYPGYMNGGAQTGRLAAQAIIAARAPARRI